MTFAAKRLSREEDMRPVGQHLASPQVVEDALMLGNPITEITMAMEVNYFQLNSAEYFVPVAVKIPGRELALARRGGAQETVIDFIGEVKDDFGNTIQNLRDKLNIKLSESTASQLARPVGRFMIF